MKPRKILDARNVVQVELIAEYSMLLVLNDKTLSSYALPSPLAAIDMLLPQYGRRISHANLFKVGTLAGELLICCVKTTSLSNLNSVKVYKAECLLNNGKKSGFTKIIGGPRDTLTPYKVWLLLIFL